MKPSTWSDIEAFRALARRYTLLTKAEELDLAQTIRKGGPEAHQARTRFVQGNLRLVVNLASKFRKSELPLPDLIQEGTIGLMKAVDKFDPDRGFKFSTMAVWWIRQAMTRASQQCETIQIPIFQQDIRNRVVKSEQFLTNLLGRSPTTPELADFAGITQADVLWVLSLPVTDVSLEEPINDESNLTVGDFVQDEGAKDPESTVMDADFYEKSAALLLNLPERERLILQMRYGDRFFSLDAIGDTFGLSKERIRQLLERMQRNLRAQAKEIGIE